MRKALFCAAMMAALFPATAHADVYEGSTTDAVGETTPAHDIAAISARYDDRAGAVSVSVQLAAPATQATDAVLAATLSKGCGGSPFAIFGTSLAGTTGIYQTDDTPQKPLTRGGTPPTITLEATDFAALAYEGYDCLRVVTAPDSESTYDDAEITLTNVTPQPTPTPTPVATASPTPTPAPTPPPLGPSPLTRAEKLEAALAKCASKKCRTTAHKRYGPTKRDKYRAALEKCRSKACERRAKARFRGVKPAPKPTGLERRLYAYGASDVMGVCGGICWEALSFVDRRYVYVGLPEGAGVPNCTRVTYDAQEEEGCTTYKVKGKTLTVLNHRYTIGKDLTRAPEGDESEPVKLERQVFPSAGARWDVPEIEAIAVWGSALISQTITKTYLTLNRAGQFIRSSYSFGGTGPGAAVTVNFATAPKDTKGTYEVLPAGTIKLTFEDGHTEVGSTFFWDAGKGRDPNQAGLHVIDDTFFGPPDD